MSGRSAKERADGLVRCCRGGLSIGPEPTAERAGAVYFACDFPATQVVIVQRHFASAIRAAEVAADAAGYARGIEEAAACADRLYANPCIGLRIRALVKP